MRTWGPRTSFVGLWLAIACSDGSQNAAGTAGVGNAAGARSSAGAGNATGAFNSAGAGNAAGYVGDCQPTFRETFKCFSDCAARVEVETECENGVWDCPPGSTAEAQCPLTPCPNTTEGCCAPGAAIATPLLCDVFGDQQSCPARSTFGTKAGDPCPMPDYCDVQYPTDLAGENCSFLGSTCVFSCTDSCACTQSDAGAPTWQCTFKFCDDR